MFKMATPPVQYLATPPVQYQYDPTSQGTINGMRIAHKSYDILNRTINEASTAVSQATEAGRCTARGALNYDQFLQGILLPDESLLLSGQYMYYTQVQFYFLPTQSGTPPPKAPMTRGRVFITNKRLLFLSAEEYQGLSVCNSGVVGEDLKPQCYQVKAQSSDVLHYQSLALDKLKSLELHTSIGVSTETNVQSSRPCWLMRCLGCFCACLRDESCLKVWYHSQPLTNTVNFRQMIFGALLPPWDHRGTVTLHLHPTFATTTNVRDFLAELQRYAPGLQCFPGPPTHGGDH